MDVENNFIKPVLLFHFSKGKSETEAHKDISKQYGPYAISLKTINKWFGIFSNELKSLVDKESNSSKQRFAEEFLIDYIEDDSDLNTKWLEKPVNCSKLTISTRLTHINSDHEILKAHKDDLQNGKKNLTEEFLINLINKNPDLSMKELARLAHTSQGTISKMIQKINMNGKRVNYVKKKVPKDESKAPGKPRKFTDEFLINLIDKNPDLNMKELARLANTTIPTISNRIKQLNNEGLAVNYRKKNSSKGESKFTDEFLINLIDENPELNMENIARLANVSQSTISRRLKKINEGEENLHYNDKNKKKGANPTDEFLIDLINENPHLSMAKLAKLAGTSSSYISRRIKIINSDGERVKYISKKIEKGESRLDYKPKTKFTDECLISLVNKHPELNITELAMLLDVTRGTVTNRLKKINFNGEKVSYCKKNVQVGLVKFTNEFLIDLINKNPDLKMDELAILANVSQATISNRLKQINSGGQVVKYTSKRLKNP